MTTSAQLEREAEATRSQLIDSLDELRDRITPGQLVDQVMDYAKDGGGGDFVRNLGRQVRDNPLPVCLVGAGLAWLALSGGRASSAGAGMSEPMSGVGRRRTGDRFADARQQLGENLGMAQERVHDRAQDMRDRAEGWASATGDRVGEFASTTRDRVSEFADTAADTAGSAYESARRRAASAAADIGDTASSAYQSMTDGASSAYQSTRDTASRAASSMAEAATRIGEKTAGRTRNFFQFCAEQPLILAGIGLAIGAAIGAALPSTETEDRLMGDTSDQLKDQAQDFAQEQLQKGKAVAEQGMQQVRDAATQQGLVPDGHDQAWTEMNRSEGASSGSSLDSGLGTPLDSSSGPSLAPTDQEGGEIKDNERQEMERHGAG